MPRRRPDHAEQVDRLLAQAAGLPHGPTRVELCEEAARVADLHNDPAQAYRAREELVEAPASAAGRTCSSSASPGACPRSTGPRTRAFPRSSSSGG